jgi:hypothetical protein
MQVRMGAAQVIPSWQHACRVALSPQIEHSSHSFQSSGPGFTAFPRSVALLTQSLA